MNIVVADFTAVSIDDSAAPNGGSALADVAVLLRINTHMDLDVVSSGSMPHPSKASDANAIEKA